MSGEWIKSNLRSPPPFNYDYLDRMCTYKEIVTMYMAWKLTVREIVLWSIDIYIGNITNYTWDFQMGHLTWGCNFQ